MHQVRIMNHFVSNPGIHKRGFRRIAKVCNQITFRGGGPRLMSELQDMQDLESDPIDV